jgi:hypothetical protein
MGLRGTSVTLKCIVVAALMVAGAQSAQDDLAPQIKWIGKVDHQPIAEMSGLVRSRRYPDAFWSHNDSGDAARLFAINRSGDVIIPPHQRTAYHGAKVEPDRLPWPGLQVLLAAHLDWEDIAIDDEMIYIADMGNNYNDRRDLGVYVLYEPNPLHNRSARILKFIPVHYPEQTRYPARQWHYDCEAVFADGGKLYFITKHRAPGQAAIPEVGANLYRLDSFETDFANPLTRVESNEMLTMVTGADLSANGQHLAVLTYTGIWVFDRPASGDHWLSGTPRGIPLDYRVTRQVEAVAWIDDDTLLISNEQRDLYEVNVSTLPAYRPGP